MLGEASGPRLCAAVVGAMAALAGAPSGAPAAPAEGTHGTMLGSHSMLYLNTEPAHQEALFRAARDAGVEYLRMPFAVTIVYRRDAAPDLAAVRRIDELAVKYGITVLAGIEGIPWYLSGCPSAHYTVHEKCTIAAQHTALFSDMVRRIVRSAPHIHHWELGNEPDIDFGFHGTPAEYAAHASLVAREYAIPAVVGTGDATRRLHPGQLVTVDGTAGTVTTHDEPAATAVDDAAQR